MKIDKKIRRAFTLVEMMLSVGCGSLILAAVVTAGVCLQRSFAAVEGYSTAESDQLRVLDYIAMDCRRAISGTVSGLSNPTPQIATGSWVQSGGTWSWVPAVSGPTTLILSLPAYYDSKKPDSFTTERGSVLLVALLTITILTLICATSLYVTSQNANAGMQTASWQQALTGAESGVDQAIRALNTSSWS